MEKGGYSDAHNEAEEEEKENGSGTSAREAALVITEEAQFFLWRSTLTVGFASLGGSHFFAFRNEVLCQILHVFVGEPGVRQRHTNE